jgi:hypothetical protein
VGIILAIPAARGLLKIIDSNKYWSFLLFLLVFLYSGIMTTSHIANVELVIPWEQGRRDAFTSSEITAAKTVIEMAGVSEQTNSQTSFIITDHFYTLLFEFELQVPNEEIIDASEIFKAKSLDYQGILVLRQAVTDVISITYEDGHGSFTMDETQYKSFIGDSQSSMIYNNGMVIAFQKQ